MRIPGLQPLGARAARAFELTPADLAGVRRAWGWTKAYVGGAASDLLVTGGELWDTMFQHPRVALGVYVVPTFAAALGKTRREYRTRDPQDTYGTPTAEGDPDA